jgi:glycosyltransferase involved in cell wall biosynthesis
MISPPVAPPWRISHVITRLIVGGAQENTISSVLGLRDLPGFSVELLSGPTAGSEGSLESQVAAPGLLTRVPDLVRPVRPWQDWLAYRQLLQHYRKHPTHLVHTHSGKAGILGRLAARRAGVPVVVHTVHGPSFGPFQGWLANSVFRQAERHAARATDHFVVVADAMSRQYLDAGIGRPDQYTRIFSGFDLQPFLAARRDPELAASLGLKAGDFVVGKVARLFELKGHDDLFVAAGELIRRIPNLHLLFVGDGPWRARFEKLAAESPLQGRVHFTGLVPPTEVPRYVGLMDALVHLSRREGLPRALPQAMAAGKPVVAVDCDGAGEVCLDGQTGFLLPADHLDALVNRLGQLADAPELREEFGAAGRAFVIDRFSTQKMVADLATLYRQLLQAAGVPPHRPA